MKLWALITRYRLHSGEFQVRVPLNCRIRAKIGARLWRGRVERGTVVVAGPHVLAFMRDLGAPAELIDAAAAVRVASGLEKIARWAAFCSTYDRLCGYRELTRSEGEPSGPS